MGMRQILFKHRALFGLFIACAIAARAFIPAGWMPSATAGQIISICSGSGATTAWLDANGKLHKSLPKSEKGQADAPCAFAGLVSAADVPPAHDVLALAPTYGEVAPVPFVVTTPGRGLIAPPPFQTGPPLLS